LLFLTLPYKPDLIFDYYACVVVVAAAATGAEAALEDYGCLSFAIFENSTKLSVVC